MARRARRARSVRIIDGKVRDGVAEPGEFWVVDHDDRGRVVGDAFPAPSEPKPASNSPGSRLSEFPERARGEGIATTLAWFPVDEYDDAVARWPSLADDWQGVPHDEYCRRFQRALLRLSSHGLPMRGVARIRLGEYLPWCDDEGLDPELPESRAHYAAELTRRGVFIPWPPGRNDPCWCGSGRKYKRCCATVSYQPDET